SGEREHGRPAHGGCAEGDAADRPAFRRRRRNEPPRSEDAAAALRREGVTMLTRKLAPLLFVAAGCTFHSTDSTEVGVLTRKIGIVGKGGVQQETYLPGATYTFPAFITDWNVYNVALQNLAMVRTLQKGDRGSRDDVEVKTHDGNDIAVDVTVAWRVDPAKSPWILEHVGGSTEEVKENLVRPACRSIVRDVLNAMTSEEFYVSEKRFVKAEEAREKLAEVLGPEGVIVERVILGEHHFHPDYEKVIHDKKDDPGRNRVMEMILRRTQTSNDYWSRQVLNRVQLTSEQRCMFAYGLYADLCERVRRAVMDSM